MKILYEIEVVSKAERYGPWTHISVGWEAEDGSIVTALFNPTLYRQYGLKALGMENWHKGN